MNKRDQSGFTLMELLIAILLVSVVASLSLLRPHQQVSRYYADNVIFEMQSIVSAVQHYIEREGRWPSDSRKDKCSDVSEALKEYIGGVVFTNYEFNCPDGRTKGKFRVSRCVPSVWVSYLVNGLSNARQAADCDSEKVQLRVEFDLPGAETYLNSDLETASNSTVIASPCPEGLRTKFFVSTTQYCFGKSVDWEKVLGYRWQTSFNSESNQLMVYQYLGFTRANANLAESDIEWRLVSDSECGGSGSQNKLKVIQLCVIDQI